MRKFISIAVAALTAVAATAAIGCGGTQEPSATQDKKAGYLINSFENMTALQTTRLQGLLGKMTLNDNADYVKDGEKSLKVMVDSNPYKSAAPYFEQFFELQKEEKDYRDFGNIGAIAFYVYNDQAEAREIGVELQYASGTSAPERFTLSANAWTKIVYTVERQYIPEKNGQLYVPAMNVSFDRGDENEYYYVDDIRIYETTANYQPIEMKLGENEICSFDYEWQVKVFQSLNGWGSDALKPKIAVSRDIVSGGSGSAVRVECPAGEGEGNITQHWPGVSFHEDLLALIPWGAYGDDARFCFDIYAPVENGKSDVFIDFYSNGEVLYKWNGITILPGQWKTYSISVAELNQNATAKMNFSSISSIVIRYGEFMGDSQVFYLDNFRMELN